MIFSSKLPISNILYVSANRYQNSALYRLSVKNFHTLKHLTSKLKAHVRNAVFINIPIYIHFTIGYSVKKFRLFLGSGSVRR
jgi:hypothetical protein